ncbi:MAG: NAD(P)/FAD-dependent oxidoreductase [Firmicutes bacterium]|nr:NAD(P)/FAD-dependent oxidoreductase [Bacillota bacterium]
MMRYIIVGGGVAGVNAAKVLRDEDSEGDITIISGEPRLPYLRPQFIDESSWEGLVSGPLQDKSSILLKECYRERRIFKSSVKNSG